jgi:hypothetical protein
MASFVVKSYKTIHNPTIVIFMLRKKTRLQIAALAIFTLNNLKSSQFLTTDIFILGT